MNQSITVEGHSASPVPLPQVTAAERLRWALWLLWRGKSIIIGCALLLLIPGFLYLEQISPLYRATATVLIEAPDVNDALSNERGQVMRLRMTEMEVQTQADIFTSTLLADRVIQKLELDKDPEFNTLLRKPSGWQQFTRMIRDFLTTDEEKDQINTELREQMRRASITRLFLAKVEVRSQRRSQTLSVSFSSENREKAARVVNTLVELYLLDRLEVEFDETRRVSAWLADRIQNLETDVRRAEAAVEAYRSEHGLRRRTEREGTVLDQQLTEINSRLTLARAELAQKQARLGQIRSMLREGRGFAASSDVLGSPLIQRLREQESQIERELSEALKVYGENHPRLVALRADMAALKERLQEEIDKIAVSIANDVAAAAAGVNSLESQLQSLSTRVDASGTAEIRLRELERQTDASRSLYENFLARFKRASGQEGVLRPNARMLSPAEVPNAPAYPRRSATLLVLAALGLVIGMAIVILMDLLDTALRSTDDTEALTGLPTLAALPVIRKPKDMTTEQSVLAHPRSAIADALRGLRTTVALSCIEGQDKIVLVTSSMPREGKSFVSLSLAQMHARAGEKTLLVDADLHLPRLHGCFDIRNDTGLAQLLEGEGTIEDYIHHHPKDSQIDFIPAGSLRLKASEVITLERLNRTFGELRDRYDRIIIDSPPVLAIQDTRLLAQVADKVIYLVHWGRTPRGAVRSGIKLLREARAPLLGTVLSQVNTRRHSRYGYTDYNQYYARYRGYYGE